MILNKLKLTASSSKCGCKIKEQDTYLEVAESLLTLELSSPLELDELLLQLCELTPLSVLLELPLLLSSRDLQVGVNYHFLTF